MTTTIRRPKLLSRAARAGAAIYRRERDLTRLLPKLFGQRAVLPAIIAAEAACESERRTGVATYSVARHVSLLAALVAESRAAGT
ncbi:hypothetical protein G5B40_03455 [Pikeienuella piscinae]|uniref:Uncharacterized protein n=1 Tax=Pikeienuella piscinae TaxID=2748098 RepID=A0A7L5BT00_9RHOB|nr:DUF6477 family protein [Pikeienuella piscinae]QIE54575.1 hypothetical protein G5B40_03455 [Pikeienuella piscinae]